MQPTPTATIWRSVSRLVAFSSSRVISGSEALASPGWREAAEAIAESVRSLAIALRGSGTDLELRAVRGIALKGASEIGFTIISLTVSLIAVLVWLAGLLLVSELRESMSANDLLVAIVVTALTWTIFWFARHSRKREWLR